LHCWHVGRRRPAWERRRTSRTTPAARHRRRGRPFEDHHPLRQQEPPDHRVLPRRPLIATRCTAHHGGVGHRRVAGCRG
jgi:hypothetical protein